jgi:hypothetical protein
MAGRLKLSNVSSRYGAPMGRRDLTPPIREEGFDRVRLHLRRVYIDSGGYDNGGAYWGFGVPLYQCSGYLAEGTDQEEAIEYYLRAGSREAAKQQVRTRYPAATFYN